MTQTILIVDGELYIRRILAYKLRCEDYQTFEAQNTEGAREILARESIDLLLIDVKLETPTSGFDLAAEIRAHEGARQLPIIILTEGCLPSDIRRSNEVAAAGYITKPFSTSDLIRRIRGILGEAG